MRKYLRILEKGNVINRKNHAEYGGILANEILKINLEKKVIALR